MLSQTSKLLVVLVLLIVSFLGVVPINARKKG